MTDYISFRPQDAQLPAYIRFSVSKTAFRSIAPTMAQTLERLRKLSASKVLMAVKGQKEGQVNLFTSEGTYFCVRSDPKSDARNPNAATESLLITGFCQNTLDDQNHVMKYGVCFRVQKGIIIQLTLRNPCDMFFDIANGKQYPDHAFAAENVTRSIDLILKKVAQSDAKARKAEQGSDAEENYQPGRQLAELLLTAENYSNLSSQLDEQTAQLEGNVAYSGIQAVEYDRIDRVAYQFGVVGLNEELFKPGIQVEIEDKYEVRHNAEIIEVVKADADSPATAIKLLFNKQISISAFYRSGWFSLSLSTVTKDVQVAAIEKIRHGEASAKYMDAMFGGRKPAPAGFDDKDLSALKARLQQQEHPLNASQMDAVCAGINARDVFLVMGPPGTGKTTVIREWVRYFVEQENKRVLISSQNNKAVDNVLVKFADEQDIDIIRIGSESKLQADVIPYMFENKVAALRRSIVDDSAERLRTIDRIVERWQSFSRQLERIIAMKADLDRRRARVDEAIRDYLVPKFQQLQNTVSRFQELEASLAEMVQDATALSRKLKQHEGAGNAVSRLLTGVGYKTNLARMKELLAGIDDAQVELLLLSRRYPLEKDTYQKTIQRLISRSFRDYGEEEARFRDTFRELSARPRREEADIWGLFSRSENHPLNSTDDCRPLQELIAREIDAAGKLRQILSAWQSDMDSKQNYALNDIVLESVDLVGATCIGINSQRRFSNLDFDVTIIDEAGQIQIHNALVPMSVSNKLIMLGDHQQIPPNADPDLVQLCQANEVNPRLLETSLFEDMYRNMPESNRIMLNTQYRIPADIAGTISDWFYGGAFYSPPDKHGLKGMIPRLSARPFVIIDTSAERSRLERKDEDGGCTNHLEASVIAEIVRHLAASADRDLKEIGVISAYRAQVKLIKNRISRFLPDEQVREMVSTLDSFQGQERDVILYSFTRSSTIPRNRSRIGFLSELRRLNVAMTRSKKTLVLVGDMDFLSSCLYCRTDENGEELPQNNERIFSAFIRKMLDDVRGGRGEIIPYRQFLSKMKGGDS